MLIGIEFDGGGVVF